MVNGKIWLIVLQHIWDYYKLCHANQQHFLKVYTFFDPQLPSLKKDLVHPDGPELLESLKQPPYELNNYNPNAKTDVTLYSQL